MIDLDAIKARRAAITPAPWYPRATDDQLFMNARYVSTEAGPGGYEWGHDGKQGLDAERPEIDSDKVIAITLLQAPPLATADACDGNTEFIAHAPTDIDALIAEVERLREVEQAGKELIQRIKQDPLQIAAFFALGKDKA